MARQEAQPGGQGATGKERRTPARYVADKATSVVNGVRNLYDTMISTQGPFVDGALGKPHSGRRKASVIGPVVLAPIVAVAGCTGTASSSVEPTPRTSTASPATSGPLSPGERPVLPTLVLESAAGFVANEKHDVGATVVVGPLGKDNVVPSAQTLTEYLSDGTSPSAYEDRIKDPKTGASVISADLVEGDVAKKLRQEYAGTAPGPLYIDGLVYETADSQLIFVSSSAVFGKPDTNTPGVSTTAKIRPLRQQSEGPRNPQKAKKDARFKEKGRPTGRMY